MPTRPVALGLNFWSHATTWPALRDAALAAEGWGYDHLWTADHLLATIGSPFQPIFEGWTLTAALAALTRRARLGVLVSPVTFRHPGLIAKMAVTLDHVSGGRAVLGLGSGWFGLEHSAHGIPFARPGIRVDQLGVAAGLIRRLMDGDEVSYHDDYYDLTELRHAPRPLQARLPLLIGGGGERKTLAVVARHADLWNVAGTPEEVERKNQILVEHCRDIGRNEAEIERTVLCKLVIREDVGAARSTWEEMMAANGAPPDLDLQPILDTPQHVAANLQAYLNLGFRTVIVDCPAPYDLETIEHLAALRSRLK